MNTNLISISQSRDQDLLVKLNKAECIVTNKDHEMVMKDSKSKDNCYLWIPLCTTCGTQNQNLFNDTVEDLPKLNSKESQGYEKRP